MQTLRRAKENKKTRNFGTECTVFLFFRTLREIFQAASRKFSRTFLKFSRTFLKFSRTFLKKSRTFLKFSRTFLKKHARGSVFSLQNEKKQMRFFSE